MNDLTRENTDTLLATLIDEYAGIESAMSVHEARVAAMKADLALLASRISDQMAAQNLTAAGGAIGIAEIERKHVYRVNAEEWSDLYAHIAATGEFDLLHRRLSTTAVEERVRAGAKLPPGVSRASFDKLNIKPRKK